MMARSKRFGLGLDAGGTATRWQLCDADEKPVASGETGGLSGLFLQTDPGRQRLRQTLASMARHVHQALPAEAELRIVGGFTGTDGRSPELEALLATVFAIPAQQVRIVSDIEVAYRSAFQPGEGYLVYAGTGSIAAYLDTNGVLHRAGGRGVGLDDAGGGYWIAREALRQIWRREDESPGVWRDSALARKLFEQLGGSDWECTRNFFYTKDRGEIGMLARAVAETAEADATSGDILRAAGMELARLALALTARFGAKPIVVTGRAARLHPIIQASLRERLPNADLRLIEIAAAETAARWALSQQCSLHQA